MSMSNAPAILNVLNTPAFDIVRDEIRASLLAWAKQSLARYQKDVSEWKGSERMPVYVRHMDDYKTFPKCRIFGSWIISNKVESTEYQSDAVYYPNRQKEIAGWTLNEAAVLKDADQQWIDTKAFYAARVGEKADLIGGDGQIKLVVGLDATLVGTCTVTLGEKILVLRTSLKTNYRYGENAADGNLTIYRQVPTLVESTVGFDIVAAEKAIEKASKDEIAAKKAKIAAINAEIKVLEKAKDAADGVYGSFRWTANGCQTSQAEGPPNAAQMAEAAAKAKDAFKVLKGIREQIKAAKAALKAAKGA